MVALAWKQPLQEKAWYWQWGKWPSCTEYYMWHTQGQWWSCVDFMDEEDNWREC